VIKSDRYTHDSLIGGCIITKRRPVATTRTRNLFADCKEILKYDQLVQHHKRICKMKTGTEQTVTREGKHNVLDEMNGQSLT